MWTVLVMRLIKKGEQRTEGKKDEEKESKRETSR